MRVLPLLPLLVSLVACKRDAAPESSPSAGASGAHAAEPTPAGPLVLAPANRIRWAEPPASMTDVAAIVRDARAREKAEGRSLIVYVGATWCEPCQRFHHAVEHGELDAAFPALTVLAFDADRDSEALATAGYVSRLIPLFALPAPDGRASGKKIEGSVKGEEAVSEITPRLRALIADAM